MARALVQENAPALAHATPLCGQTTAAAATQAGESQSPAAHMAPAAATMAEAAPTIPRITILQGQVTSTTAATPPADQPSPQPSSSKQPSPRQQPQRSSQQQQQPQQQQTQSSQQPQLPRRAALVVHEIFGTDPLSEHILPTMAHVTRELAAPGESALTTYCTCRLMPSSFSYRVIYSIDFIHAAPKPEAGWWWGGIIPALNASTG